jgi:hypothetical protein
MPEGFYCTTCDGTNIQVEAEAEWDAVRQEWQIFDITLDGSWFCSDCDGQCDADFREITDLKTLARIAIHTEEQKNEQRLS